MASSYPCRHEAYTNWNSRQYLFHCSCRNCCIDFALLVLWASIHATLCANHRAWALDPEIGWSVWPIWFLPHHFFTPSMSFEEMAKFRSDIFSSGLLLLLSNSRLSENLSMDSSSLWRLFSNFPVAWCPCTPEPKRFNEMSNILRALSRLLVLFAITQLRAVPSKLLVSALHSCFLERFSSSKCNFITSIQVSMQPSDSSFYDFGFLSVLLDLSPLSVDFENLVMNVSRELFKGSNIEAYIVVSCETVVRSGTDLTCGIVGDCAPTSPPLLDLSDPPSTGLPWVSPYG